MTKVIVLFISVFFLVGCGNPVGFTERGTRGPGWYTELASTVSPENKIKSSKRAGGKRPNKRNQPGDVVEAPPQLLPAEPPADSSKPKWTKQLEKEVDVATIGGKSKRRQASVKVDTDLIEDPMKTAKAPAEVDIIFVVDTSSSMRKFLRNIEKAFRGFIPALAGLNWRIFFTNADHGNNGLFLFNGYSLNGRAMPLEYKGEIVTNMRYISQRVKDHERVFLDTLRVHNYKEFVYSTHSSSFTFRNRNLSSCRLPPYCQSWNEQPLKSLSSAFIKNKEYLRPSADTAAVLISDSDEAAGRRSSKRTLAQDVVSKFETKYAHKKLKVYGILMLDRKCQRAYGKGLSDEDKYSYEISKITDLTGGAAYSLCDDNYVSLAKQMVSDFQP